MTEKQDKKKAFFVETEDEKKQPKNYSTDNEEVIESYTSNPKQPQTKSSSKKLKKYPVILATPTFIVISDNGNGVRIDNNSQNKKIGDEIELELP